MDSTETMANPSQTMGQTLFTVITPTIGRAQLTDTLISVPKSVQHIVVADGVDIKINPKPNVVYTKTPHSLNNCGHSPRMYGWFHATGRYIGYIDDDDVFLSGAFNILEKQIADNPGYDFYFFPAIRLGQIFYSQVPAYGRTVSCQYVHAKYDSDGQPIIFGDGIQNKDHGCDGYWIESVIKRYRYKMLECAPLVDVRQIGNGKRG